MPMHAGWPQGDATLSSADTCVCAMYVVHGVRGLEARHSCILRSFENVRKACFYPASLNEASCLLSTRAGRPVNGHMVMRLLLDNIISPLSHPNIPHIMVQYVLPATMAYGICQIMRTGDTRHTADF